MSSETTGWREAGTAMAIGLVLKSASVPPPRRQKVGVAHAEINTDHVLRRGHSRIKLRGPRVIAAPRPHPADAAHARFLDRQFRSAFHHQMAQSVVAVDKGSAGLIAHDLNVGARIDGAALDLLHVLRQAEHAVRVPAARIRFGHQSGHNACVPRRYPRRRERPRYEFDEGCDGDKRLTRRNFCAFTHACTPYPHDKTMFPADPGHDTTLRFI
jgi:hypothetical protein